MKKTLSLIICLLITCFVLLNMDSISDKLANFIDTEKSFTISNSNEYAKDYNFKFISQSEDYIPYSYQDLLNILYSILNNGWEVFTFYCPTEYEKCISDIDKMGKDTNLLSNINNFVHPYNSFSKIGIESSPTGEITIKINKLYNQEDINKINLGVEQIFNNILTSGLTDKDKILVIHDYIINNTKYDTDKKYDYSYTAIGPLSYGTAVCSGYADLMAIILTKLGYKNFKVASETHVWNAVLIDGEWLNLDLTWDDPITVNSDIDTLLHQFYLINTEKLLEFDTSDHNFDTTVYQELK